ncbi:uncharacterized protein LOC126908703 [Daktulosphaira vitifoliae]|uniref:uncharacterized protein LOC126908703 n=1 Tax=Daktulosphaira vitifoliae TaxID=58002 RepID=UPI0021AAB7FD|nr:uncharacterized protein LOC126908703 [Daktulosphaira vitifoliae]XP_050546968.1 uncharacterized protein LOC126908703 [Daktulosphaira vitifoliae]
MEYLLNNPYWKNYEKTQPDAGIKDLGKIYTIGKIIAKDDNGKIVNDNNLECKIRHYYTLIRCIFTDKLKVIVLYLSAVLDHQEKTKILWEDFYTFFFEQIDNFESVFDSINSSLSLLARWYFEKNNVNKPAIDEYSITRVMIDIKSLPSFSKSVKNIPINLEKCEKSLDEIQENYFRFVKVQTDNDFVKKIKDRVQEIFKNKRYKNIVEQDLRNETTSIIDKFFRDFDYLGFIYNTTQKIVSVKEMPKNESKSSFQRSRSCCH